MAAAVVRPTTETIAPATGACLSSSTRPSMLPFGNELCGERAGTCAYAVDALTMSSASHVAEVNRFIAIAPLLRDGKRDVLCHGLVVGLVSDLHLDFVITGVERGERHALGDKHHVTGAQVELCGQRRRIVGRRRHVHERLVLTRAEEVVLDI